MRRQWPIWVLGLALYGFAALLLLTRIRIPSPLHLVVFVMATAVLSVTALRVEWGILALVLILPFGRPGITLGDPKLFHISGFNVALVGVTLAYLLRYLADAKFSSLGPMVRRTRLDWSMLAFASMILLSSLWSFNLNETAPRVTMMTAVHLKEHALYFVWFYLLVTLLRTPTDLRQFAVFFAFAGLAASLVGMITRLMGGSEALTAGSTMVSDTSEGAGGRMGGGWFGLGHPNTFAALLLMTMPIWFFAVNHLKHGFRRLVAEVAVVNGFLGILFTYSRAAWFGSVLGIGLAGLADRKALSRVILFGFVFAVAAQTVILFTTGMNLVEVVAMRFQQLESSDFSARPQIFDSAMYIVRHHPLLGVGLGAFQSHAPAVPMGWVPTHAHNAYLAYATEAGIPAAFLFSIMLIRILAMSVRNLKRIARVAGYGFIALGSSAALIGLSLQGMVEQVFRHRMLGFAFYALVAIVVALDRMITEGRFDTMVSPEPGPSTKRSAWIEQ